MPVIAAAFALWLITAAPAFALFGGKIDSFSADNVEIDPSGKVVNTSKIYMAPDALRMDGMPGGGGKGIKCRVKNVLKKRWQPVWPSWGRP
ncbi:MAG: hypothetical protein K9L30_15165 [Desulfobacterales bacterium]|nr:hypothetical protein [Desulfobacterales bacterium]